MKTLRSFLYVENLKLSLLKIVMLAFLFLVQFFGFSNLNAEIPVNQSLAPAAPVSIIISNTTLTNFDYTLGYGPSSFQFLTVSGSNFSGNLTITPPTDFEISLTANSGYQSTPITLIPSANTISSTNIFVRLKSGLSIGNYNSESIAFTSTGLSTATVECSGSVVNLPTISASAATSVCVGSNFNLLSTGTDVSNLYWLGPNAFYSIELIPSFTNATVSLSGIYTVTGSIFSGLNLIKNGDFESGNTDFTSSYIVNSNLQNEGSYAIVASPKTVHSAFGTCSNHTSYGTLQMVVNGAVTAGVTVWSQTAAVKPNTDYQFTYFVQSVVGNNPSKMQLFVNGVAAGPTYTAITATCLWKKFIYNWNSGTSTVALLALQNQNTVPNGNDFALDDIVFQETVSVSDSTNIVVNPLLPVSVSILASATAIYSGSAITFTATPINAGTSPSYQWAVNDINVGTNIYTHTYVPVNGDKICCTITTDASSCSTGSPAKSNVLTLVVIPGGPTTYINSVDDKSIIVFSNEKTISVKNPTIEKGTVNIFDIAGKLIQKNDFNANCITTIPTNLKAGSYIVKSIIENKKTTTQMIMIR